MTIFKFFLSFSICRLSVRTKVQEINVCHNFWKRKLKKKSYLNQKGLKGYDWQFEFAEFFNQKIDLHAQDIRHEKDFEIE